MDQVCFLTIDFLECVSHWLFHLTSAFHPECSNKVPGAELGGRNTCETQSLRSTRSDGEYAICPPISKIGTKYIQMVTYWSLWRQTLSLSTVKLGYFKYPSIIRELMFPFDFSKNRNIHVLKSHWHLWRSKMVKNK